jgi:hypothetical protein
LRNSVDYDNVFETVELLGLSGELLDTQPRGWPPGRRLPALSRPPLTFVVHIVFEVLGILEVGLFTVAIGDDIITVRFAAAGQRHFADRLSFSHDA